MPLAEELRPHKLEDFVGQVELVGPKGPIRKMLETGNITSMIFWGPPGSGKTTLARIISDSVDADFLQISAVIDGKEKLKEIIKIAAQNLNFKRRTILFIDEIHRWNKAQQDALLPYVESGQIILIGATTENPSFTVISPLLSRSRVFVFKEHSERDIVTALKRAQKYLDVKASVDVLKRLAANSNGDLRYALNTLEIASQLGKGEVDLEQIEQASQRYLRHDKAGEEHYNLISAVHKSLRSSNASAAVYWITRMLAAGEDPLYIARRLVRFASEDIGNANPNALLLANVVYDTCHKLGMPECDTALVQLAQYLAKSPKDNSAYVASSMAKADVAKLGNLPVPLHFRNAPTRLMKDIGYGKGYEYDHNLEGKKSDQQCFPDELKDRDYFPEPGK